MKNILLVLIPSLIASSALAYETPVVLNAPETPQIEETKSSYVNYFMRYDEVVAMGVDQLLPNYISTKYLASNSDASELGYEIEVGGSFKNIELSVGYRDFSTLGDQLSQTRASLLLPVVVSSDYIVQLGGGYIYSELEDAAVKNESTFVTIETKAFLSISY